jgi:hypothetical protein
MGLRGAAWLDVGRAHLLLVLLALRRPQLLRQLALDWVRVRARAGDKARARARVKS